MASNSFGHIFKFTSFGESHGKAIGVLIDGCPPNIELTEPLIQVFLDKRKPGQNKFTTQRKEDDKVEILSGTFEGKTTGTPIQILIKNLDQRSKDYSNIATTFRRNNFNAETIPLNPFWSPDEIAVTTWANYLDKIRKAPQF